jgi:O-antigen ligase
MVAALGGLSVLLAAWWLRRPGRLSPSARVMLAVLPVVIVIGLWVATNPGLTGRTSIWPVYANLWVDAPWTGQGQRGIDAAIQDGRLPDWAHHGHNLLLDTAARYGLLGLVLLCVVLAAALATTVGAARRGDALGLALMVVILVAGLTETTLRWLTLTVPVATLILAVLMSGARGSRAPAGPPTARGRGSDPDQAPEPSVAAD